jgi:hypothetical protein
MEREAISRARQTAIALGLLLLASCSRSSEGTPFESAGTIVPADSGVRPPPKTLGDRCFLADGRKRALWIRTPERELPSRGLLWVRGTLRGDQLEITDLFAFGVDRESQIPAAGELGALKISGFVATGACNHMPSVPPENRPCPATLSAEVRVGNGGETPVECTLERAFVSYSGAIGRAVTDFALTCDRGNGTPITLAAGTENRAIIALLQPRIGGHGDRVFVTLIFAVGTERRAVRTSGMLSVSE